MPIPRRFGKTEFDPYRTASSLQRGWPGLTTPHAESGRQGIPDRFAMCTLNGLPAIVVEWDRPRRGEASRTVQRCEVDESGRIVELQSVLATRTLLVIQPVDANHHDR
jgi:hypothetical protein